MLLYCSGYHIYCRGCNLLQGMQSTAYHTNTGYMAFELSHISYHMAPEHAMLLQGTPRCSRVLHCSIGCLYCGYHTNTGYMAFELSHTNTYHMAPEHAMLLQGTPRCSRVLHCSIGKDTTLLQRIPCNLLQGMQYLLQGMQTITPADTTLIQGIWPLNYLTYHTIWLQNMLCCSRVLHVAPGAP